MKSPKVIRIPQIVLGAITIALLLAIISTPRVGIATITFLLSTTSLVVGIGRLVTGFTPSEQQQQSKSSRFGKLV